MYFIAGFIIGFLAGMAFIAYALRVMVEDLRKENKQVVARLSGADGGDV